MVALCLVCFDVLRLGFRCDVLRGVVMFCNCVMCGVVVLVLVAVCWCV